MIPLMMACVLIYYSVFVGVGVREKNHIYVHKVSKLYMTHTFSTSNKGTSLHFSFFLVSLWCLISLKSPDY